MMLYTWEREREREREMFYAKHPINIHFQSEFHQTTRRSSRKHAPVLRHFISSSSLHPQLVWVDGGISRQQWRVKDNPIMPQPSDAQPEQQNQPWLELQTAQNHTAIDCQKYILKRDNISISQLLRQPITILYFIIRTDIYGVITNIALKDYHTSITKVGFKISVLLIMTKENKQYKGPRAKNTRLWNIKTSTLKNGKNFMSSPPIASTSSSSSTSFKLSSFLLFSVN